MTINSLSKTFSVTGWRVGWAIAPPALATRHPQGPRLPDRRRAGAAAGGGRLRARPAGATTTASWRRTIRRAAIGCVACSSAAGSAAIQPSGAYYIMTDMSGFGVDRRRRVRADAGRGDRRGRGAGEQLLSRSRPRSCAAALLLLQARRDDRRSRPPPRIPSVPLPFPPLKPPTPVSGIQDVWGGDCHRSGVTRVAGRRCTLPLRSSFAGGGTGCEQPIAQRSLASRTTTVVARRMWRRRCNRP